MAFTNWCDLYNGFLDKLSDGDITVGSVTRGNKTITYRSGTEFFRLMSFFEQRCKEESGVQTRRTYAGNAGNASGQ